jgi:hypothetical protein
MDRTLESQDEFMQLKATQILTILLRYADLLVSHLITPSLPAVQSQPLYNPNTCNPISIHWPR